jgi:DNA-binding NarL/FixJ family response regulator
MLPEKKPDIVLLGQLAGQDELEALRGIRSEYPEVPVLICFTDNSPTSAARSLALEARGRISVGASRAELLAALRAIARGGKAWDQAELDHLTGTPEMPKGAGGSLTPRERQILRQLSFGMPNREIASLLGISIETAKEHVASIRRKLGVRDRTRAAGWAIRNGMD